MRKIWLIIFLSLPFYLFAQTDWRQAPLQLATRWSKEVSPQNGLPAYPRPQMVRKEWESLNGLWDYAITDSGANHLKNFQGKILVPYPIESALSGVKKGLQPNQQLWYQKSFELKKKEKNKQYLLHFWSC